MAVPSSSARPNAPPGRAVKKPILDLNLYLDQQIHVKLSGGREIVGILKGYDNLMNLVLDDTIETLRDPNNLSNLTDQTRKLGLTIARGTGVTVLSPTNGSAIIENPWKEQQTVI